MNKNVCKIDYPCRWTYKVIGSDEGQMRSAVSEIVGERHYTLNLSRSSINGKYHSLNLQMNMESDESRVEIYEALRKHQAIQFVL